MELTPSVSGVQEALMNTRVRQPASKTAGNCGQQQTGRDRDGCKHYAVPRNAAAAAGGAIQYPEASTLCVWMEKISRGEDA